jgi:hypothetical protein
VGGTSQLVLYPADRLVLAIVTNLTDARLGGLVTRLERVFLRN